MPLTPEVVLSKIREVATMSDRTQCRNEHLLESEVSIKRLKEVLDAAMIDNEIDDDGDLAINDEPAAIWVSLVESTKFILLHTFVATEHVGREEGIARANALNQKLILNRFSFGNERLAADFWIFYGDGINARQFVKNVRRFSAVFREAMIGFDSEDGLVKPTLL
jgi:T3SS (YopN, CesT) and YbjN peptide-binding chaperone 1